MKNELLHTTEGVRDFYGKEYADRRTVSTSIFDQMLRYGYEGVETPTFEYFDLFAGDLSPTSSREMYKFFDKEGDTLVLRSDFTPAMARCACKYFLKQDAPTRICYQGQTFMNTSSLQGKLNEYTQMGVELMNDGSVYADAEIIALLIDCLQTAGLKEFQISIGDAGYFKGICTEAGLNQELEDAVREQIAIKNYFAAEKLLTEADVQENFKTQLLKVSSFLQSEDDLRKAAEAVNNQDARDALSRLIKLHRVLTVYGVAQYVSYDLGMLNRYNYYTGMIFKAYTYGVGDAIASGGRYDSFLEKFGYDAPAVGFVIILDDLMNALYRQRIVIAQKDATESIAVTEAQFETTLRDIQEKRKNGTCVRLQVDV